MLSLLFFPGDISLHHYFCFCICNQLFVDRVSNLLGNRLYFVFGDVYLIFPFHLSGSIKIFGYSLLEILNGWEPGAIGTKHGFPYLTIEFASAYYCFSLFQDFLDHLQQISILILKGGEHTDHKARQTEQKLLIDVQNEISDDFQEGPFHFESRKLVEVVETWQEETKVRAPLRLLRSRLVTIATVQFLHDVSVSKSFTYNLTLEDQCVDL